MSHFTIMTAGSLVNTCSFCEGGGGAIKIPANLHVLYYKSERASAAVHLASSDRCRYMPYFEGGGGNHLQQI